MVLRLYKTRNIYCIILIAILFLWHNFAGAQVITGVVCDQDSKLPVPDVYIYLDGTSVSTITDNSGKFELKTNSVMNTILVLHHLSYEPAFISRPFDGLPDTLYIKERIITIEEVTVRADQFTREQKIKAFREQFLGTTRAGLSCTIENEDDIELTVNTQTQRLFAFSDKPIVVVNNYLGYKISFILIDFQVQYRNVETIGLGSDNAQNIFFAVVSSFTDLNPESSRMKRRRNAVYEQSPNYFFKSFANGTLNENNFIILDGVLTAQNYFAIKDTLSQKIISIMPNANISKPYLVNSESQSLGMISVLHRKTDQTTINFMTDSFWVDRYGNIDQIDKIVFTGQMGKNRAGGMLPIDYE